MKSVFTKGLSVLLTALILAGSICFIQPAEKVYAASEGISVDNKIYLPANAVISDSIIDPTLPVMYAVDTANSKLYAINYETKSVSELSFNLKPDRIAYSNGELYITLLKANHESGAIAVINTADLSIVRQMDINIDPYDIIVSGNYIYVTPKSGETSAIESYSKTSGQLISSSSISLAYNEELNNAFNRIYAYSKNSNFVSIYTINDGSISSGKYSNDYIGNYYASGEFKVSPDGKYLFDKSGLILSCHDNLSDDIRYKSKILNPFRDIAFDSTNSRFFTAVSGKLIFSYDYTTFKGMPVYASEGEVSNLYYRNNKLVALSVINNSQYAVELIDLEGNMNLHAPTVSAIQLQKDDKKLKLPYSVKDSVMDPNNSVLYIADDTNKKIASINYETGETKEISTYYSPKNITYFQGDLYVGYGDQYLIAIYDAQSLLLEDYIFPGRFFYDIAVGNDGCIYVSGGDIYCYSRSTKQELSRRSSSSSPYYISVHPIYNSLYFVSASTPIDMNTVKYESGNILGLYDSPYHGDYPVQVNFRISPDGKYIFNGSGLILTCNSDESRDLRYVRMLNKAFNDIAFDLANGKFYIAVEGKYIYSYDYNTLKGTSSFSSEGEVSSMYYKNNELIALSVINGSQYIEKIALSNNMTKLNSTVSSMQLTKDTSKLSLNYTVSDSVISPDGTVVYIADTANKKVALINYETGETKEITTYYSPQSVAYRQGELYVGYGDQKIVGIYDAQSLELKDFIGTTDTFFDMNVANDGFIYVSSDYYVTSYSRVSKQEIANTLTSNSGKLEIHPDQNLLYKSAGYLTTFEYNIGTFKNTYDLMFPRVHSGESYNSYFSPDGKFIFNGIGYVYATPESNIQKMRYYKTLNNGFVDMAFDIGSNKVYTAKGSSIQVFDYSALEPLETYSTQGNIKKLYLKNGKLVAISNTSTGKDIIEFVNTPLIPGSRYKNVLINQTAANSCTISWDTDEPATTQVEYGVTQSYGSSTILDTALTKTHKVVIDNLSSKTTYHFKLKSTIPDSEEIPSKDFTFTNLSIPSIDIGMAADRIVYDAKTNKAYAINYEHMKLMVIDLIKMQLEKSVSLGIKPNDLCLSDDSAKVFIVNYDGTVSEYFSDSLNKIRDMGTILPWDDFENTHYHIKYRLNKLYLADGFSDPVLWTIDLTSLETKKIENVYGIGDLVFSSNTNHFYFWYQIGWGAGWAGSYINKYFITDSGLTAAGTSNQEYDSSTGMPRDPLDTPIMLIEDSNKLICKNKVFDTNNLNELNTFSENIYAVDADGTLAVGKSGIYRLSDYTKIADTSIGSADKIFFDNKNCLYYIGNSSSRIYYDNTYAKEVPPASQIVSAAGVTLNLTTASITTGQSIQLSATVTPENATNKNVAWSVTGQNPSGVIALSADGLVTAQKPGTATVRAESTSNSAIYDECSIIVVNSDIPATTSSSVATDTSIGTTTPPAVTTGGSIDECFIATAAFGSKLQPAVSLLRKFRDKCLLTNWLGTKFVEFYYKYSPPIAHFIAGNDTLRAIVRIMLLPLIAIAYGALHPAQGGLAIAVIVSLVFMIKTRRRKARRIKV